ncbi:MAG: site-specific DNA-methyltransferase [Gammaproteobacteria bacterium]|nr:site-specific DNA-methyltransferase [Gammaproteobacteria bacterium]
MPLPWAIPLDETVARTTRSGVTILTTDALTGLASLPDQSVHMVITSPPYYHLRDYRVHPTIWPPVQYSPMPGVSPMVYPPQANPQAFPGCTHNWGPPFEDGPSSLHSAYGQICRLCGAWRGCLGQEPSLELYIGHIVHVARALRRVLRPDGTFWLNVGDSRSSGKRTTRDIGPKCAARAANHRPPEQAALGEKNLFGIPWRIAFALQSDGWTLRSDIVWAKRNPLPESVKDRPSSSHEMMFLFASSPQYYYDHLAVREPHAPSSVARQRRRRSDHHKWRDGGPGGQTITKTSERAIHPGGHNKRDVWFLASTPYKGAHFAVFPIPLVKPAIQAGTAEGGVCAICGTPASRQVTRVTGDTPPSFQGSSFTAGKTQIAQTGTSPQGRGPRTVAWVHEGWAPGCACHAPLVPATVLDPFGGAGTTALVARSLGRQAILIEASPESVALAWERIGEDAPSEG